MVFIRPILEYAYVVWCKITKYEDDELEKILFEAARIVTGTTKLVSIENLYKETGWETLSSRRRQLKLTLYYKMTNYLTPAYLSSLLPPLVGAMSRYPLRNSEQYQTVDAKSQLYYNSFLPSTIREWNTLGNTVQSCSSVSSFKIRCQRDNLFLITIILTGSRNEQILHAKIRTNCSSLHYTLFSKNIIQDKLCTCGQIEDVQHFLFSCARFTAQRQIMLETVQSYYYYVLIRKNHILTGYEQNCISLASLCSRGDWFKSRCVGNPQNRLCRVGTHLIQWATIGPPAR